jgi:hypothetical protein
MQMRLAELGPSFETNLTIILGKGDLRGNQQRYKGRDGACNPSTHKPYPTWIAGAAVARRDRRSALQLLDAKTDCQGPQGQYAFTQQRS